MTSDQQIDETYDQYFEQFAASLRSIDVEPDAQLERDALVAIAEGNYEKADQLIKLIERRNKIGLKVIK